jgi:hypothetical protein
MIRIHTLAAASALALAALAQPASALTLYSNFDPLAVMPPDYQPTVTSSLSGSCGTVTCGFINAFSVGFTFTPTASGEAGRAYIPFELLSKVPGAENIYGLTITNADDEIVATTAFDAIANTATAAPAAGAGALAAAAPPPNPPVSPPAMPAPLGARLEVARSDIARAMSSSEVSRAAVACSYCAFSSSKSARCSAVS